MGIVKYKGKWKDSGQYNLYFSTTLIKTQVFTALCRDTEIAEKFNCVPWFQNQACLKLKTSSTLEPNAQKLYNYILSHIVTCSLEKRVYLPMLPESLMCAIHLIGQYKVQYKELVKLSVWNRAMTCSAVLYYVVQ